MNDVIENKIHQLKELSKKQKKLSEIKKDIADILGNANMDEKKEIAKEMSKIPYENIHQARNLQFIVPHIVKELYDHEGQKGEFVIPKKTPIITTPIIEDTPIIEETSEEKKEEKKKEEKKEKKEEKKEKKEEKKEEKNKK